MGLPPRSLTAEANSCFMVRVPHGPNRIQGCGASIAPECGLPSDQLYQTSNNEGQRVAVTLDTKVPIQGCVKTWTRRERAELFALFSSFDDDWQSASFLIQRNRDKLSTRKFDVGVFTQPGSNADVVDHLRDVCFAPESGLKSDIAGGPVLPNCDISLKACSQVARFLARTWSKHGLTSAPRCRYVTSSPSARAVVAANRRLFRAAICSINLPISRSAL
jgi:hypothetical protein